MNRAQPLFDPTTHYRVEVRGQVDVEWLQRFDGLAETHIDETPQGEGMTVLNLHTDQSGIVGLLRALHGLGVTILLFRILAEGEKDC